MSEAGTHIPAEIREMLSKARPEQLDRLLWEIVCHPPRQTEGVRYDA